MHRLICIWIVVLTWHRQVYDLVQYCILCQRLSMLMCNIYRRVNNSDLECYEAPFRFGNNLPSSGIQTWGPWSRFCPTYYFLRDLTKSCSDVACIMGFDVVPHNKDNDVFSDLWSYANNNCATTLNVESGMGLHCLHTWISVKTEIKSPPDPA